MAKGRTSQPVTIWVWYPWVSHPAIAELHTAGHRIGAIGSEGGLTDISDAFPLTKAPDLILHPAAHGWDEAKFEQFTRKNGTPYRPFVEAAVKAGRQRRRGK